MFWLLFQYNKGMSCNNCCRKDDCCGGCNPARYSCMWDIQVSPYDPLTWLINCNGTIHKVRVPNQKLNETDTKLSVNNSNSTLVYQAEKHTDIITGEQLGGIINLDDLRDVNAPDPENCSILVFNPFCTACGDGCRPVDAQWMPWVIPDAGDCILEPDNEGYYHVLKKNDCGCPVECRLPVMPSGSTTVNWNMRDSVPDDPDFPWYYGIYNDTINLHLAENAPTYFGKYDLEVTINYGIQVTHPTVAKHTNFRSLIVPVVEGTSIQTSSMSSILQGQSGVDASHPWGTISMRGSITFIVPKGKEAYLHHEFRLRALPDVTHYLTSPYDGQRVPDEIASQIDRGVWTMSRLNALQLVIHPAQGISRMNPATDTERGQLDPPVDSYYEQ